MSSPFSDKTQSMPGLLGLNKIIQTQGWDEYFMVAEVHENIHSFSQSIIIYTAATCSRQRDSKAQEKKVHMPNSSL